MLKPILCLDFDGVIHSYSSGWKGADVVTDPPVDGALQFIHDALVSFDVQIFSSRSNQVGGVSAMRDWLTKHFTDWWNASFFWKDESEPDAAYILSLIKWPTEKPAAMISIDDRALTFEGEWPKIGDLLAFKPWNKRPTGATGTFSQGKISDDDQGDLKLAVAWDKLNGVIRIEFGKPVAWLALDPMTATALAEMLLKHARF